LICREAFPPAAGVRQEATGESAHVGVVLVAGVGVGVGVAAPDVDEPSVNVAVGVPAPGVNVAVGVGLGVAPLTHWQLPAMSAQIGFAGGHTP